MRCLRLLVVLIGIIIIVIGFVALSIYWYEPSEGWQILSSTVFSSSFPVNGYETKITNIVLQNESNYSFELNTHFDEPLNVSWAVHDPNRIEITVFDLEQLNPSADQETTDLRVINGKFNSTISGIYQIVLNENVGQNYLAELQTFELNYLYYDSYPHAFNLAPIISLPIFLIGGGLIMLGLISLGSNKVENFVDPN